MTALAIVHHSSCITRRSEHQRERPRRGRLLPALPQFNTRTYVWLLEAVCHFQLGQRLESRAKSDSRNRVGVRLAEPDGSVRNDVPAFGEWRRIGLASCRAERDARAGAGECVGLRCTRRVDCAIVLNL